MSDRFQGLSFFRGILNWTLAALAPCSLSDRFFAAVQSVINVSKYAYLGTILSSA
ncbi:MULTISPECIES: hypothetical protein [Cyanophyceae]|uniref:hypothetical protein n=1 Tax=Cyanophyceae TaxID=3028117 RepID=UPI001A7E94B5|nr:hypothetical protein [Phormidium sp. FACHB-592]